MAASIMAAILQRRGVPFPKEILEVFEEASTAQRPSIHASQPPVSPPARPSLIDLCPEPPPIQAQPITTWNVCGSGGNFKMM
jgi:hypothetical protein